MIPFPAWPRLRAIIFGALIFSICFVAGCSHHAVTANIPPPPAPASTKPPPTSSPGAPTSRKPSSKSQQAPAAGGAGYVEEGIASWYGFPFQGRRTSDGEIYDMNQMVAAHRTLPFNTIVRVTNLNNGLQTEVRIIDRGPFVEGRIIDLSLAAAKALDLVGTGTAPVRLEIVIAGPIELPPSSAKKSSGVAEASPSSAVPPASSASVPSGATGASAAGSTPAAATDVTAGIFAVQIGAFGDETKADNLRDQLAANYPSVSVSEFNSPTGNVYRVFVGRYTFEAAAQEVAAQIQAEHGIAAFVVRVDPTN